MKYIRKNAKVVDQRIHETDVKDTKGRAISYRATISREEVQEAPEYSMGWNRHAEPYRVQIHQQRDGYQFGPIQRSQFANTLEEAKVLAMKAVTRRVKAAAKKWAA